MTPKAIPTAVPVDSPLLPVDGVSSCAALVPVGVGVKVTVLGEPSTVTVSTFGARDVGSSFGYVELASFW